MKDLLGKKPNNVKDILARSSRAVCGINEREVVVKSSKVASTIARLRKKGFVIVGISHGNTPSKKIWFNPSVGF